MKAGLHALVRHVARLCGKDKIRCNGVAPGLVVTEGQSGNMDQSWMDAVTSTMPLGRVGLPRDLAAAMAFLLSDDGDWITGQVISVDGGTAFRD